MKAPEDIPYALFDKYSMQGKVAVEYSYRNDCSAEIQEEINQNFTEENLISSMERIKNREVNYYGYTDLWVYEALEKYPIEGKTVCVVGSTYPWYEAMALQFGAKRCVVFEYSKREAFDDRIVYLQPEEIGDEQFDVCFSISSFEHDGLGRYGDPLNPDGDLEAMERAKKYVKKDGIMILSVPWGKDKVFFNVHRVYGYERLPKLIEGWTPLDRFGFDDRFSFTNEQNTGEQSPYQPVLVLRNDQ